MRKRDENKKNKKNNENEKKIGFRVGEFISCLLSRIQIFITKSLKGRGAKCRKQEHNEDIFSRGNFVVQFYTPLSPTPPLAVIYYRISLGEK